MNLLSLLVPLIVLIMGVLGKRAIWKEEEYCKLKRCYIRPNENRIDSILEKTWKIIKQNVEDVFEFEEEFEKLLSEEDCLPCWRSRDGQGVIFYAYQYDRQTIYEKMFRLVPESKHWIDVYGNHPEYYREFGPFLSLLANLKKSYYVNGVITEITKNRYGELSIQRRVRTLGLIFSELLDFENVAVTLAEDIGGDTYKKHVAKIFNKSKLLVDVLIGTNITNDYDGPSLDSYINHFSTSFQIFLEEIEDYLLLPTRTREFNGNTHDNMFFSVYEVDVTYLHSRSLEMEQMGDTVMNISDYSMGLIRECMNEMESFRGILRDESVLLRKPNSGVYRTDVEKDVLKSRMIRMDKRLGDLYNYYLGVDGIISNLKYTTGNWRRDTIESFTKYLRRDILLMPDGYITKDELGLLKTTRMVEDRFDFSFKVLVEKAFFALFAKKKKEKERIGLENELEIFNSEFVANVEFIASQVRREKKKVSIFL